MCSSPTTPGPQRSRQLGSVRAAADGHNSAPVATARVVVQRIGGNAQLQDGLVEP